MGAATRPRAAQRADTANHPGCRFTGADHLQLTSPSDVIPSLLEKNPNYTHGPGSECKRLLATDWPLSPGASCGLQLERGL